MNESLSRELPAENAYRGLSVIGFNQKRRKVDAWQCSEPFARRFVRANPNRLYRLYAQYGGGAAHEVSRDLFRKPKRFVPRRKKTTGHGTTTPF